MNSIDYFRAIENVVNETEGPRDITRCLSSGCEKERCDLYIRYCDEHGYLTGFRVGPSTIEGAGMGLFTINELDAGDFVGVYSGEVVEQTEAKTRQNQDYMFNVPSSELVIDSVDPYKSGLTRYVNDATTTQNNNLKWSFLKINSKTKIPVFLTKHKINAGSELFISYGKQYW